MGRIEREKRSRAGLGHLLSSVRSLFAAWRQRHDAANQRRALRALDDHMLKDIGLSRADVARLTGRSFQSQGHFDCSDDADLQLREQLKLRHQLREMR